MRYDPRQRAIVAEDVRVPVTPLMSYMLDALCEDPSRILSWDLLIQRCYGRDEPEDPLNSLKVTLCHLRRRLRVAGLPNPIEVRHGHGVAWRGGL